MKFRSLAGSAFASMKASISGWSQRIVPIIAPRLAPADMIVLHMASQTSMKLTGPDASAPTPRTWRAFRPERREVVTDAAALLQGEGGFPDIREDRAHVVADLAHDETIEERYVTAGAGSRQNSPCREERKVRQRFQETLFPGFARPFRLDGSRGACNPDPSLLNGLLGRSPWR